MQDADRIAGKSHDGPGELLVSVCPDVLHDAEHAVGNYLQRIHHMARVLASGAEAQQGERLRAALGDLERLLELLFDYVSPPAMTVRPTEAVAVADSLAAQVRGHVAGAVAVGECPALRLLVDPKMLSRAFQMLGAACGKCWQSAAAAQVEMALEPGGERLRLAVRPQGGEATQAPAEARLAAAVAAQLIEMQGGELQWSDAAPALCALILPVHGGENESL